MTQNKPAEWAMKAAVSAFDQPLPTDSIMFSVARAIEAAANAATERAARYHESAFVTLDMQIESALDHGRKTGEWDMQKDNALVAERAFHQRAAAAIRKGGDNSQ